MFKLPKNRLCVGKTNQGIPFAFVAEHLVSAIQNPHAAHIVWVRLDSGESIIAEHPEGLVGLLRSFDIEVSAQWMADLNSGVPKEHEPDSTVASNYQGSAGGRASNPSA